MRCFTDGLRYYDTVSISQRLSDCLNYRYCRYIQFSLPSSDLGYHKFFKPSKNSGSGKRPICRNIPKMSGKGLRLVVMLVVATPL